VVPDPITFTSDPIPDDAALVTSNNPAPSTASAPLAKANADPEAQYAESLALRATPLGISAALLGLLGNNILTRRAHVLTEDFKAILLTLTN
jgi:hypothetical protein